MFVLSYLENSDYGVREILNAYDTHEDVLAAMKKSYEESRSLLGLNEPGVAVVEDADDTSDAEAAVAFITAESAFIGVKYDTFQWSLVEFPEYVNTDAKTLRDIEKDVYRALVVRSAEDGDYVDMVSMPAKAAASETAYEYLAKTVRDYANTPEGSNLLPYPTWNDLFANVSQEFLDARGIKITPVEGDETIMVSATQSVGNA